MRRYRKVDVSEQELEDIIRREAGLIENGLVYVDHQRPAAGGRLDVLLVDSGKCLVVAELKVIQDDNMLVQALDYYDYVSTHVEAFARLYRAHSVDPTQEVRLILVAPAFSQTLVSRCRWFDVPISLFTYVCLYYEGEDEKVPVFAEQTVPSPPEILGAARIEDHLNYITDLSVRSKVSALLDEIKNWRPGSILIDPIKYSISMKVNGRVFAYLGPRRQHYVISTYDLNDVWKDYAVKSDDDLTLVKPILNAAMERRAG
jgi:hypothetical protein